VNKSLHIISFDIPFPANYGGVIDVFYKLKALYEAGVSITLHCFEYGDRQVQTELNKYCKEVYYYKRKKWVINLTLPYLVSSRNHPQLIKNLLKDDAPILFEGLHSTYLINNIQLKNRIKLVRMHNIEHDYYDLLAASENNIFLKTYYYIESKLLKNYECRLHNAQYILAISAKDYTDLHKYYGQKVKLTPAFHGNKQINIQTGKGDFSFYHGKLSVAENNLAALYLVNEVFSKRSDTLIIGGDGASKELQNAIAKYPHIDLKQNLNPEAINEYIRKAHINILPTFQATGIKLKLINVMYNGRFILVNSPMVAETGLAEVTQIADSAEEMNKKINLLNQQVFSEDQLQYRKDVLKNKFDVQMHAHQIIELLD